MRGKEQANSATWNPSAKPSTFTISLQVCDNQTEGRGNVRFEMNRRSMKAKTKTIILGLILSVTVARGSELTMAIDAAIEAPRTDFLTITPAASLTLSNSHLKLYPVYMLDKKGPAHMLAGTISHQTADGTIHTVAYRIAKHRGVIKEILLQVDHGDLKSISPVMMKALGIFLEKSGGDEEERRTVATALQKAVDGSWLSVVELIVAHIGMRHC
jgi:hypothetical protein